jgi:hypothetical protein
MRTLKEATPEEMWDMQLYTLLVVSGLGTTASLEDVKQLELLHNKYGVQNLLSGSSPRKLLTTFREAVLSREVEDPQLPDAGITGLPKSHWIYEPPPWTSAGFLMRDTDGSADPNFRQRVSAALKRAIKSATQNGTIRDFDPDALLQTAMYELCGPSNEVTIKVEHGE